MEVSSVFLRDDESLVLVEVKRQCQAIGVSYLGSWKLGFSVD